MKIKVKITRTENATYYSAAINDVVEVELDDYVAGVVASEIGNSSIEACKAQAIAARTFAYPYYSKGNTITDASQTHQAFRAPRISQSLYPNALTAAKETSGLVLSYGGTVINTCSYSASNGGRTVSSQERWGGYRAWLIAQDDPWDSAAGTGRQGHGVGMSQRGCKYAASIGVKYDSILSFYYPGTSIVNDGLSSTQKDVSQVANTVKAQDLVSKCKIPLEEKWGYIWGERGATWTASKQKAATREMTVKYGSQWIGRRVTDCSGLIYWAMTELGGSMYHGSNTMWNKWCTAQGKVTPGIGLKPGTAMFLYDGTKRHHVGIYVGNDTVIESKGTMYGVVTSKVSHWDEWGELKGVDYSEVEIDQTSFIPATIKNGSKGETVRNMQQLLISNGYSISVDGSFGPKTEEALKAYQQSKGLTVDGICGPATWTCLLFVADNTVQENDEDKIKQDAVEVLESQELSDLVNDLVICMLRSARN